MVDSSQGVKWCKLAEFYSASKGLTLAALLLTQPVAPQRVGRQRHAGHVVAVQQP